MFSENYRYYHLDGVGQLHDAEWFEADSDEEAVALIEARHPDGTYEIWQGKRLVASVSPQRRGSIMDRRQSSPPVRRKRRAHDHGVDRAKIAQNCDGRLTSAFHPKLTYCSSARCRLFVELD